MDENINYEATNGLRQDEQLAEMNENILYPYPEDDEIIAEELEREIEEVQLEIDNMKYTIEQDEKVLKATEKRLEKLLAIKGSMPF